MGENLKAVWGKFRSLSWLYLFANNSTTTKAREKISTYLEFLESWDFLMHVSLNLKIIKKSK